ncbi:MAG: hypothetical protein ISR55_06870 [Bacteroidetes bacterium]|nr:hypothetical protein [Bacteroidota bacterium]MBL6963527.1 hypothetical protein [Bacteroidota bacterium]
MLDVLERFKKKYAYLEEFGLKFHGLQEINSEKRTTVISISKPLIFDSRLIPDKFEGLRIKRTIHGKLPKEFKVRKPDNDGNMLDYVWAPERFELFIDRNMNEIREKLEQPEMTREDILDALCFGDFEAHKMKCERLIMLGKIPAYVKPENY